MAISICKILCVPLVTQTVSNGKDYFSTYLVYILAGLTVWLVDVCWSIFFLWKQSVVNNWFIYFLIWLIFFAHFRKTYLILRWIATNCNLAMNFWWISSIDISSSPTLAVNPRITLAWKTFLRSFIWQLKITTHPSHVHGRSKPWHLQDFVVERHVRLRNQHLELISVQAKLVEKLLSTSHFSRQMLLAYFSFYQNRFCQTLSKELLFSAKFPFRKSCQKHQTLLFQSLKLLQLLPISLSLQKAI